MKSNINRPTFSQVTATDLDKTLQEVSEFAGKVCSFGEADGFFKIEIVEGISWNVGLEDYWEHLPPEYYEYVSPQGFVYPVKYIYDQLNKDQNRKHDLSKQMREEDEKNGTNTWGDALKNGDPRLIDGYDDNNLLHWVVNAKAGLVCLNSQYQVRTGFWTRIVSPSFDLAFQRTKELWEEEHNREEHEKDWPLVEDNYNAYTVFRCREEKTIEPLVKDLKELSYPEEERFTLKCTMNPRTLTTKQCWQIFDLIQDMKEDIKFVEEKLGDKIYDQRFIDYRQAEEEFDRKRDEELKPFGNSIPWEEIEKGLDKRSEMFSSFLKSIGAEEEDE